MHVSCMRLFYRMSVLHALKLITIDTYSTYIRKVLKCFPLKQSFHMLYSVQTFFAKFALVYLVVISIIIWLCRSQADVDSDNSSKDFAATEIMDLFHELNPKTPSLKKKPKAIFDREEIKNPPPDEPVNTQVIRLLPSQEELRKLESKLKGYDCFL